MRFIPNHIWWNEILPFLNRLDMRPAYNDKNLADLLIGSCAGPRTILKRMHGRYYSPDNKVIKRSDALRSILLGPEKQIIKASQTDNGVSIRNHHLRK